MSLLDTSFPDLKVTRAVYAGGKQVVIRNITHAPWRKESTQDTTRETMAVE